MLFRNEPEDIMIVDIGDGNCFMVPREVSTYIDSLKDENFELMKSKQSLLMELDSIKPVINSPGYEPALSRDCGDCKYVVRGRWNGEIIGCRKNNVCEDFVPREGDIYD